MRSSLNNQINITVVGSGYVGMSLSVLLAQQNNVTVFDIDSTKISLINSKQSTIKDNEIDSFMQSKKLFLKGTLCEKEAFLNADYILIATPTNYDPVTDYFDTSSIESVIEKIEKINTHALIIIKSTIPIGYTNSISKKHKNNKIIFSPEFLREGKALHDNLYPSRIVIGDVDKKSKSFASILKKAAKIDCNILYTSSMEAEAIKLFANSYLAMRVAFFNELDSFSIKNELNSKNIIDGISLDKRIGMDYNNPSFGYGGYCLPKDTKQLLSNYKGIPQALIGAIVESNSLRKDFLSKQIMKHKPKVVGVYRLIMKNDSDNFRSSAIQGIMNRLKSHNIKIIIYEPSIDEENNLFDENEIVNNLELFLTKSDIIIANRITDEIKNVKKKIFSRDVYGKD